MLPVRILGSIIEQFENSSCQIERDGHYAQAIRHFGFKPNSTVRKLLFRSGNTLVGYFIARHLFFPLTQHLNSISRLGTVKEHEHHTLQVSGIVLHHGSDFLQVFFLKIALCIYCTLLWHIAVTQYLCKAQDDLQRSTYLV